MSDEKTPEQLAAEAAAAVTAKAAEAAAAKAKKAEEKAVAKAAAEAKKVADKAAKETAKAEAKLKKDAAAAEKAAAKEAEKANKPQVAKMPEQNGVRRPKPEGACGKVWAFADQLSGQMGQPVPIAQLSAAATAAGINDSTIRTQYALWRKFHGITGRVTLPVPATATVAGAQAAA